MTPIQKSKREKIRKSVVFGNLINNGLPKLIRGDHLMTPAFEGYKNPLKTLLSHSIANRRKLG